MIDHLEIQTEQLNSTIDFYASVLEPLGYRRIDTGRATGFGCEGALDFFVVSGPASKNVHYAFSVGSRQLVDEIYALAARKNLTLDRPPALAPNVHANYYAGYLRDPDDRLIEFVCQKPE